MRKDKIEWSRYCVVEAKKEEKVFYDDLDRDLYVSKYKNHLFCISGCNARIKFTHRKDNRKFFSTWNKEGNKHNKDCPFSVVYKGTVGRKKLEEISKSATVSDEHIMNTLRNKSRNLKNKDNEVELPKGKLTTRKVINGGEDAVPVVNDDGTTGGENTSDRVNINSIDAAFITPSYLNLRRCVFGKIKNVQIRDSDGEKYAYLNLENTKYNVSAYLPPAFYYNEDTSIEEFEKFISILKKEIENADEGIEFIIIAVGFIGEKQKEGLNVRILNPKHLLLNDMTFNEIIRQGKINRVDYKI